jgi:hypothetical protein
MALAGGGDPVDRDEQRLLQHRRKQFRDGFLGVVGHVGSPVGIRRHASKKASYRPVRRQGFAFAGRAGELACRDRLEAYGTLFIDVR